MSDAPANTYCSTGSCFSLVEHTTLTFKQIADFYRGKVEVQGIADGEVAKGIKALQSNNIWSIN